MIQTTPDGQNTLDEVVERGQALYDRSIRAEVETPENKGKLLMVDILTGDWAIGTDRIEMGRRARLKNPDAVLYGVFVGYLVTEKIGRWPRNQEEERPA